MMISVLFKPNTREYSISSAILFKTLILSSSFSDIGLNSTQVSLIEIKTSSSLSLTFTGIIGWMADNAIAPIRLLTMMESITIQILPVIDVKSVGRKNSLNLWLNNF